MRKYLKFPWGPALGAVLLLNGCSTEKPAGSGGGGVTTGAAADHGSGAADPGHAHVDDSTPVPASLSGIWTEVEARRAELSGAIAANQVNEMYTIGVRIRNLVAAMPALSGQYVATREGPLEDAVKRVAEISDLLHNAADSGNAAAAANATSRLDSVLDYIQGLYPPGVLAGS